jgi:glutaredoxin-like protein
MELLNEQVVKQIREIFAGLNQPVRLLFFTQGEGVGIECATCADTRKLLEEVSSLSEQIKLDVRDFLADEALAQQYGVDKIPGLAILRDGEPPVDYGIRLYGIPSGYEFTTLIQDILMVSQGESDLSPATLERVATIDRPVHIQVYVTPT